MISEPMPASAATACLAGTDSDFITCWEMSGDVEIKLTANNISISPRLASSGGNSRTIDLAGYTLFADEGFQVINNDALTISDSGTNGKLYISGVVTGNAAIGGNGSTTSGPGETAGTVTVTGGTVNATGGDFAAGIGGGYGNPNGAAGGAGGTVTVSGGTVNATGGQYAAGIGGGGGQAIGGAGGTLTVQGGKVNATGGDYAAGIGGGRGPTTGGAGGTVTVVGGSVTSTGGYGGTSIGGGYGTTGGAGGTVTVSGGEVKATGGGGNTTSAGAGIGSGTSGSITGATGSLTVGGSQGDGTTPQTNGGVGGTSTRVPDIAFATAGVGVPIAVVTAMSAPPANAGSAYIRFMPSAPVITAIAAGDASLSVAFTAPNDGGNAITNYTYTTDDGTTWAPMNPAAANSPLTLSQASSGGPLVNGTNYHVRIRAINGVGQGAISDSVDGTPQTTPAAPVITAIASGDASLSVAFTAPNDGGNVITNYTYTTDDGTTWAPMNPATTSSPLTLSQASGGAALVNGTTYHVRIRAINGVGQGAISNAVEATPALVAAKKDQQLRAGTPPKHIAGRGLTVLNKAHATTRQEQPVTARVKRLRADSRCYQIIRGPHRRLAIRTFGNCTFRLQVRYSAPGNSVYKPLHVIKNYRVTKPSST